MTENIKQAIRADIALALGKPMLPAFLSEQEIEASGIRSASSLQRDRAIGIGFKFLKAGHLIKYPTHEVVNFIAENLFTHTGAITPKRQAATEQNLIKAKHKHIEHTAKVAV